MSLKYTKIYTHLSHHSYFIIKTIYKNKKRESFFTDKKIINYILNYKYYAYLQTKPETNKQSSA